MNDFLVVHIFINDLCCREMCKLLKMCSFGNLCGKVARIQTRTYVSIHILANVCFITGIMWGENMNLFKTDSVRFSSVTQSCSTLGDHRLQHARLPCPSPTHGTCSDSCPLSRWCHPNISSSVIPFSFHLQSFPASGSFQMSQFFASGGQSIGVSALASVLPMHIQGWSPLGWTGWISLQSKGLSRVFSNTTVQKCQFFSTQLSL